MTPVLIVEDEMVLAFTLRRQLEARGCEVLRCVTNGRAGVESCCADHPDVVLMDIRMPVMDGLEATRLIMEQCPTCVIVMTAFGDADTAARAEAAGAMAYLTKPVTAERIIADMGPAQARFSEFLAIRAEAASLEEALETRRLVEAAKAVLATRDAAADSSFHLLQDLARQGGQSLRDVAQKTLALGPVAEQ